VEARGVTTITCIDCGQPSKDPRCDKCFAWIGVPEAQRLAQIPQRLYDAEVNFSVRAFFDAGFEWEVWGRSDQDIGLDGHADTYEGALRQMADAAAERSPEGSFARWWRGE
jgi:hypothetical protein